MLTEIIRLLITMVPQQRGSTIRDDSTPYLTKKDTAQLEASVKKGGLKHLLKNIPLPIP